MLAKSWRNNWERVIPFFAYPPEIRKVIYATNAIESLNMSLRKVTKACGSFPHDAAVFKLLYLVLRNIEKRWTKSGAALEGSAQPICDCFLPTAFRTKPCCDLMEQPLKLWAMEIVEKQTAFSHRSHSPYC